MSKACPAWLMLLLLLAALPVRTNAQASSAGQVIPVTATAAKPDYSKEAAVVEQYNHKVKFENDGTSVHEELARVRVQSDAGIQRYGLLAFSYASGIGNFDIEFVRVHKADGSTVETTADSIQDMPSEITRQAPFYSDMREKHVAVKGLGVGDVLEYKTVEHVTKPLAPGQFWFDYNFFREVIMLHEQLELSVPRERAVSWKSPELKPTITEVGSYRVYSWSRSNLETKTPNEKIESAKLTWEQSRGRFPQPDVRLSSFQSWSDVGRWYGDLQKDRVKPSREIQSKAAELTKGLTDDEAKIQGIYNYVSLQFRYIGIAFGIGRYQPHFAAEVLANQYGDCKDKHTLLTALLNAAGFKAYPALISSQREMDADMPSPSAFNHVVTVVPRGNSLLWLDTTAEVGPFQYLLAPLRDKHALVLWDDKPAALVNTPADLPHPSYEKFEMQGALDDSGTLTGNFEFSARGDTEVLFRSAFRATPLPQWKDLGQRISQSLGFAGEVSDVTASLPEKTDEPFRISYKYHRKDFGDWPNRRIVSPCPFISLPAMSPDLSSLSVPFFLGQPLDVSFHSRLELPKGYTLEVPKEIHIKNDFAEFDVTYTYKDGELSSERHLRTLLLEVPKSDFTAYEKFSKTVVEDYSNFIQLSSDHSPAPTFRVPTAQSTAPGAAIAESLAAHGITAGTSMANSLRDLPDSSVPEALRLEGEAGEAMQRNDPQSAIASLYRSVAEDPKFVRGWLKLGSFLMSVNQADAGTDAFKKAIAVSPEEPASYKMYAIVLMARDKFDDAVPVWQSYIKLEPNDFDGAVNLGGTFMQLKRYPEATKALETAIKLRPASGPIQWQLGKAYLLSGDENQAKETYRALLQLDPPADALNQAAFDIAEANKILDVALELAEKAVESIENDSSKIDLAQLRPEDEALTAKLALFWTTLGWIQDRQGKSADAEKTLVAAWRLTQDALAAARLCELYDRQHRTQAAIQMCHLAHNRLQTAGAPNLTVVTSMLEQTNARLEHLSPGSSKSPNMAAIDEVIRMRSFKLAQVIPSTATAYFYVVLEFDPASGRFKAQNAKFASGSEKLKPFTKPLTHLNFNFTSPDANHARVVRHGIFLCSGFGPCEFMLQDPAAGIPVPVQLKVIN
jgi:cytochrome c-type biogenesis protein CcmH/NrfG